MHDKKRYNDYASVLKTIFPARVQKILVNAGFSCPNRDGTKGRGGCTYCNNQSFSPEYCQAQKSVTQQIEEGIVFFRHKYPAQNYLVYFQAYTNTYGDFQRLKSLYDEALSVQGVRGLVVGTRPDCVNDELLDYFARLSKHNYIMLEYGVESVYNATLAFVNRGHSFADAKKAIRATAERGIYTGAHLILGLPHETREMLLDAADRLNQIPINALKLHQLQIIKGTAMAEQYAEHPEWFHFFEVDEYIDLLVDFLERLRPDMAIERFVSQSLAELLIAPQWGLKNFEFTAKLEKRLRERNTWQGKTW
ncbi:MAG: TIGR01212 family radical SAM protein [Prevotellaceae bacterium]|jgi:radical SAM protein (TIGR01212 family)|nr:TIGR01212 family radical SAM protein [Prevotellaceae bacterium]